MCPTSKSPSGQPQVSGTSGETAVARARGSSRSPTRGGLDLPCTGLKVSAAQCRGRRLFRGMLSDMAPGQKSKVELKATQVRV